MGIFKFKSSSKSANKTHSASEQKSVLQPFKMSRRLSMIQELEEDDTLNSLEEVNRRQNISQGTPGRNKNTANRGKLRFQKLVEWGDELDEGSAMYEPPPGFLSPENFMSQQKKRSQNFYKNGPEENEIVEVNASSLDEVVSANQDAREFSSSSESCSIPSQVKSKGMTKLFQFAAETASLTKSCSSDSSISSSYVSSRQQVHRLSPSKAKARTEGPAQRDSDKQNATSAHFRSSDMSSSEDIILPLFNDKIEGQRNGNKQISGPKSEIARSENGPFYKAEANRTDVRDSPVAFEPFALDDIRIEWPTNSCSSSYGAHSSFKIGLEWPSGFAWEYQSSEAFQSVPFSSPTERSRKEEFSLQQSLPMTKPLRETEGNIRAKNSAFAVAKSRFEATENLFKQNKSLFEEKNAQQSENGKATDKDKTPLKANGRNAPVIYRGGLGNKKIELQSIEGRNKTTCYLPEIQEGPLKKESPCKENDNSSLAVTSNSKKADYDRRMRIASPFAERVENTSHIAGRTRSTSDNKPLQTKTFTSCFESKSEQLVSPTTAKMLDICADVASRYKEDDNNRHLDPSDPSAASKKASVQQRLNSISSPAYLGAVPMNPDPNATHLHVNKADTFDSGITRSSTIDSYETSTDSSVGSDVENTCPRGIRGSFPTLEYSSSSSQSVSTASTNLLNEIEFFKRARTRAAVGSRHGGARPPTAVPPTAILSSMLFQRPAGDQESTRAVHLSRESDVDGRMPKVIHNTEKNDDASVSDITGSTTSDYMIQGSKLLNRYYYNNSDKSINKRKLMFSRLSKPDEEQQDLESFDKMIKNFQYNQQMNEHQRHHLNRIRGASVTNDLVVDKMRRHQHQFQYPETRTVRSGFDNQDDDDTVSLFEA